MNVQKETFKLVNSPSLTSDSRHIEDENLFSSINKLIQNKLSFYERPLIIYGAGVGLAGIKDEVNKWIECNALPFVSSWGGCGFVDHENENYLGNLGVYGDRSANFAIQNADLIIVLGSRLDSRQRSGNPNYFAPYAKIFAFDIDTEELKKYDQEKYTPFKIDLKNFSKIFNFSISRKNKDWLEYIKNLKREFFHKRISFQKRKHNVLSPYKVIEKINDCIDENAIITLDIGAHTAWFYQTFMKKQHLIFTAGGMAPMGYGLPAAIGAALEQPSRQVICIAGDGGIQLNIQELQALVHHNLNIKIIVLNNFCYGMIKQFQQAYFESRYEASDKGYSCPDFSKIAHAYGIPSSTISNLKDINKGIFSNKGPLLLNVILSSDSIITPKLEVNRFLHDQFPYLSQEDLKQWSPYYLYERN
jgi:acetolactate synthase-1/2/3 large subunit